MTAIERLIANTERVISALKSFTVSPAGVVNVSWINANDTETVYSFDNIKKIQGNIRGVVKSSLLVINYIDAENGDDLLGDGSSLAPYKTIKKGIESCASSSIVNLLLKEGQDHIVDELISLNNKNIVIKSQDGSVSAPTTTITQTGNGGFSPGAASPQLALIRILVRTSEIPGQAFLYTPFSRLTVFLQYSEVEIRECDFMYALNGISQVALNMTSVTVTRQTSSALLVSCPFTTLVMGIAGISVSGNTTDINDLILGTTGKTNVLSNYPLI